MARTGSNNIQAKLVLLGDMGTGKTSLVLRFVKGQFLEFQESTIGAAFFTQVLSLNEATIKFDIWDTAGQERYHSLAPMYYRGAAAAVVVYDITSMDSFERAKKWVIELQRQGNPNLIMFLVGNKVDLKEKRKVGIEEGEQYAKENGMVFLETSAKTTQNVNELFYEIAKRLAKKEKKMEKVMNIIKPKPNPQQELRDWQRRLRQECRNIERQIRDIQREEKTVQKAIRDAAKRNDMVSAKALAKEIVMSRRTVNRLYENKAQMNSISMHLGESVVIARTVGHLSKSAEVMKLVNDLMKAPDVAVTMQEFSKEMTKAGVIEEFVDDALDSALDSEDMEEEIEEEVDKVLTAIAGETAAELPAAVRKERVKQSAQMEEEEAIAEGVDDEGELEEIRARLANVRS